MEPGNEAECRKEAVGGKAGKGCGVAARKGAEKAVRGKKGEPFGKP